VSRLGDEDANAAAGDDYVGGERDQMMRLAVSATADSSGTVRQIRVQQCALSFRVASTARGPRATFASMLSSGSCGTWRSRSSGR
jgi:hypothetical protein